MIEHTKQKKQKLCVYKLCMYNVQVSFLVTHRVGFFDVRDLKKSKSIHITANEYTICYIYNKYIRKFGTQHLLAFFGFCFCLYVLIATVFRWLVNTGHTAAILHSNIQSVGSHINRTFPGAQLGEMTANSVTAAR